jgi:threonine dehydrogenase-like Zn-dependent dehydrogenase
VRAITIHDGVLQYRDDLPEPHPEPGEVVLDVIEAGICETDLQLARGYMGFSGIPGHEFVGIAQSGRFAGRRVVGEINCNCQTCPRCLAGLGNHCGHRTVVGIDRHAGAFAERVAIPEHRLHAVSDSVTNDEAVFVEPLAAALQIPEQVDFRESDRVVIAGDGRLAYLCAQAIRLVTENVTVIGKHASKLARFQRRGISTIELQDVAEQKSYDVVVDCTGSESGLPLALSLVRPRGTIVLKTTVASKHHLSLAPIVIDEISIVGSRCGPFAKAMNALQERSIDVSDLITHRFPLEAGGEAMESATSPCAFKVVFDIGSETGST